MVKILNKQVQYFINKYNINTKIIPVSIIKYGMNVELEHGTEFPISNITNDNLEMTFKITLAHLLEFPDYYQRLKKMEDNAEKYWKNKKKPSIFI